MRLLRISSKDKALHSSGRYKLVFPTNDSDLHQAKIIMLKSAIIPNSQYNVHTNNNTFTYSIGNFVQQYSVTVPAGQYTINALISELIAQLGAHPLAPLTMTITQDAITGKLSWLSNISIKWLNKDDGSPLGQLMGIHISTPIDSDTHDSSGLHNLSGLRHVYISSNALSNNTSMITDDKQKFSIFADIPITVAYGGFQVVDNDKSTLDYIDFSCRKNISSIDIELLDEHNDTLDLNGHDFILVFAVY